MNVSFDLQGDAAVRRSLGELGRNARPAMVTSINRTSRDLRARVVKRTVQVYNLSRRELNPYVIIRGATASRISATVTLQVRAVPIEAFRPRVRMQAFTFKLRGRSITRTLPAIYLKRFRAGAEKYVAPAFPLHQRTSGLLLKGDSVRRRVGDDRARLTRIRYYTFPREFVTRQLLPDARQFVPERVELELDRALRRRNQRGRSILRGNT